jgi:diguanylate cyclase (GGDEF)-like protein
MRKRERQQDRQGKPRASTRAGVNAPGRRAVADAEPDDAAVPRSTRSQATRLAAEVERLQRELAAARKEMSALAALADIDALTEVPNRRGFERECARACAYVNRYATQAALIYLDLDDFKRINDRHGHAAGDAMLKAVAAALVRDVRASDLVARVGGDEFAVLLWNCSDADAEKKTLMLEAVIARATGSHAGALLSVAASAGATMLRPFDQPAEVLHRADCAMYARKALRRGRSAAE